MAKQRQQHAGIGLTVSGDAMARNFLCQPVKLQSRLLALARLARRSIQCFDLRALGRAIAAQRRHGFFPPERLACGFRQSRRQMLGLHAKQSLRHRVGRAKRQQAQQLRGIFTQAREGH